METAAGQQDETSQEAPWMRAIDRVLARCLASLHLLNASIPSPGLTPVVLNQLLDLCDSNRQSEGCTVIIFIHNFVSSWIWSFGQCGQFGPWKLADGESVEERGSAFEFPHNPYLN